MRMDRSFRPAVSALVFLALSAAPLAAQHPNHAQGFRPEHVFEVGSVEHVNLFNGNVTLTIPLGGTYPVGPELSAGLTLTWTGNVWDWDERFHGPHLIPYLQAEPRQRSNAGLGWTVAFGRFLGVGDLGNTSDDPVYESPDQALHELERNQLHPGGEDFGSTVRFTQDGTYLRYQAGARTLEFPDGTMRTFDAGDRLVKIAGPFGHNVTIDYPKSTRYSGVNDWRLTDSHGRVHRVYFKPAVFYGRVVEEVEVEGFAGTKASYTFSYSNQSVRRPCTVPTSCEGEPCGNTDPVTLPLLTKLTLPDGSAYSMPPGFYQLGQAGTCPDDQRMINGQLERLDLPTGGAFEWAWQIWGFPQGTGTFSPFSKDYGPANPLTKSVGLAERRRITRSNTQLGRWTYTPSLHPTADLHPEELQVDVTAEPGGDRTRHYFSVWPGKSGDEEIPPGGWTKHEYGLPFTRYETHGTSPVRLLSREVFDNAGTKLRSEYVRYERSGATKANPRVVSRRTVYHDDAGRRADVDFANFDGVGHFRTVKTGGSFAGQKSRTTTTTWNPGKSVSDVPDPTELWVLDTFTETKVTEGGQSVTREFHFDQATGFLRRTRTRRNAACGGDDVIVVRTPKHVTDPNTGFLAREDFYGGDGAGLPCGDLASLDLSTQTVTRQRLHGYTCGVHRASLWLGPGGEEASFLAPDLTIDCKSGLVASSRDTAGFQTTFSYDALGRLTKEDLPAGEGADTTYQYDREGTSGLPARVTIERKNGSTVLAHAQMRFDGFGRVAEELRKLPGGTVAVRKTGWNALGLIDQRSEWEADGDPDRSVTRFRAYDPFGRPGTIILPDGHEITLGYFGEGRRTIDVPVATSLGPTGEPVTLTARTTEFYDRFGRLHELREPVLPDGTRTRTVYSYDAQDNLTRVDMNVGRTPTQVRTFNYDHRGLLRSETHPELGTSVRYSLYDPLGDPGRIRRGGWDLAYSYDVAGRLTEIGEQGTSRVWKSWSYATANHQAGRWSNGKLKSAVRHNRVFLPGTTSEIEVPVTEDIEYDGVGGRTSKVTTTVGVGDPDPPEESRPIFHYQLTYDALGNVTSRIQPRCDFNFCSSSGSSANPFRAVSQSFTEGLLTAVPGYASSITYHPNGLFQQVAHTHGVTDLQERHPNDMARPRRLRTTGASEDYDTGVYAFDGAGNVTKMGSHRYVYDLLSRVKDARVEVPGEGCGDELVLTGEETGTAIHESCGTIKTSSGGYTVTSDGDVTLTAGKRVALGGGFSVASGGRLVAGTDPALDPEGEPTEASQDYTFDRFGNLLTVTTELEGQSPVTRTFSTSSATNRLSQASYDLSGNVTLWPPGPMPPAREHRYDPFNMLWQTKPVSGRGHTFLYGPGDERVLTIDWTAGTACQNWIETWTLRDLDGTPLRQFRGGGCNDSLADWSFQRDYVYRNASLLAAHTPQGLKHFHLDHLGSPRLVTDASGTSLAQHLYFPFGEEATDSSQDDEALQFTGHERDDLDLGGTTADLDYQHARFYSLHLSRYFSFDPVGGNPVNPQSWNRYSYVLGNPVRYIDPAGLAPIDSCTQTGIEVACEGTITVTADFLPTGFANFLGFGAFLRDPGSLNRMPSLPGFMRGMTFDQALGVAVAAGAGGDCASDPNCALLADVATTRPVVEAMEAGVVEIAGGAVFGPGLGLFGKGLRRGFTLFGRRGATLAANPFKGKSAQQIDELFRQHGFELRGPSPATGRGGYVNPQTGRSYHIDIFNRYGEAPHVDVNRLRGYQGPLPKRKYPID